MLSDKANLKRDFEKEKAIKIFATALSNGNRLRMSRVLQVLHQRAADYRSGVARLLSAVTSSQIRNISSGFHAFRNNVCAKSGERKSLSRIIRLLCGSQTCKMAQSFQKLSENRRQKALFIKYAEKLARKLYFQKMKQSFFLLERNARTATSCLLRKKQIAVRLRHNFLSEYKQSFELWKQHVCSQKKKMLEIRNEAFKSISLVLNRTVRRN